MDVKKINKTSVAGVGYRYLVVAVVNGLVDSLPTNDIMHAKAAAEYNFKPYSTRPIIVQGLN
jgi:hypothetical protein